MLQRVDADDSPQSQPEHKGQPSNEGLHHVDTATPTPQSCKQLSGKLVASVMKECGCDGEPWRPELPHIG